MPFEAIAPWALRLGQLSLDCGVSGQRMAVDLKTQIYGPDDPANKVYFIHKGQIRTYQVSPEGPRRLVEILGPGNWCGATALARQSRYGELAIAITNAEITAVPTPRIFELIAANPALGIELIRQLAEKLSAFREDAGGFVFEDCTQRLVRTLIDLSRSAAASPMPEGVVVRITHQQLAQKIGVARETVSLALAELRRRNLLRTGRSQLIFSPSRLNEKAC